MSIMNVSLGAQRVMMLHLKKDKSGKADAEASPGEQASSSSLLMEPSNNTAGTPHPAQRIPLPHTVLFRPSVHDFGKKMGRDGR